MKITAPIVALHLRDQDDLPGNVVVVGGNLVFDFALSEYLMHAVLLKFGTGLIAWSPSTMEGLSIDWLLKLVLARGHINFNQAIDH